MYMWVAIDVNEQVHELREKAECFAKKQGLSSTTFTLPFHISLKISFQIPDEKFDEAVGDIREIYKTLNQFEIVIKGIEQAGPIIWIKMQENAELINVHNKLDKMLLEKYGVVQHAFDKDFRFHTSILIVNNQEKITKALDELKDARIPEILKAERFIIGLSEEGVAGTYRVIEEIQI